MAKEQASKPEAGKVDVNKEPQKSQNLHVGAGPEIQNSGEKKVIVNPELDTEKVTIPHSIDEEGNVVADNFEQGRVYEVNADLLGVKNTEGKSLLVEKE